MTTRLLIFASLLAISGCTAPSQPPAPPTPAPKAAPAPAPVVTPQAPPQALAAEWIDWPITAGDWVYRRDARGSLALFGPQGRNAIVTLRCDAQRRRVYLSREGSGSDGNMVVRTSSSMKQFAASPTGATPAYLASEIAPADPILDAMAFSRGRMAIEADGQQPIAIPAWPEIVRVVEDCRG